MKKLYLALSIFFIINLYSCSNKDNNSDIEHGYTVYNTGTVGQIGSEAIFSNSSINYSPSAALDAQHFIIAYKDNEDSAKGKIKIGTIADNTISFSNPFVFNDGATEQQFITSMDSTHIAISFRDEGDSNKGKVIIGTITGSTVTFGTEYPFSVTGTNFPTISTLDSTHFVICFIDSIDSKGKAIIGNVFGTSIVLSEKYEFCDTYPGASYVSILDSSRFVVSFNAINTTKGSAIIGKVQNNIITFGEKYYFNDSQSLYPYITTLDESHIGIAYRDTGDSNKGNAVIGTVTDDFILFGNEYTFSSDSTLYTPIHSIGSNNLVIAYRDEGDLNKGKIILGEVIGNGITFGSQYIFSSSDTIYPSLSVTSAGSIVITYRDQISNEGKAIHYGVKSIFGTATSWNASWPNNSYQIKFGTTELDGIGTPDTWFTITDILSPTFLTIDKLINQGGFLPKETQYIIRQSY